jgi:hypothetical protein
VPDARTKTCAWSAVICRRKPSAVAAWSSRRRASAATSRARSATAVPRRAAYAPRPPGVYALSPGPFGVVLKGRRWARSRAPRGRCGARGA